MEVAHTSANKMLTDPDSIQRLYSIDNKGNQITDSGNIAKIQSVLGVSNTKVHTNLMVSKHISNVISPPEYGHGNDAKRRAILNLLISNKTLLDNISNTLFLTSGSSAISPLSAADTACAMIGGTGFNDAAVSGNVASLNKLFGARLVN
uniref:Capsid protein n=1 Tax=Chionoecetes opilio bacilliform virus TaxID=1825681 RepID=A0A1Q3DLR0_9VIRU|nr:capsid protein [Chionoecetes opilio bacilliform virus]